MGEINRDCRPHLDPNSRSRFLNVPSLSRISGRDKSDRPSQSLKFFEPIQDKSDKSQFFLTFPNFLQLCPIFLDFTLYFPTFLPKNAGKN